jgi:hypothetical protein
VEYDTISYHIIVASTPSSTHTSLSGQVSVRPSSIVLVLVLVVDRDVPGGCSFDSITVLRQQCRLHEIVHCLLLSCMQAGVIVVVVVFVVVETKLASACAPSQCVDKNNSRGILLGKGAVRFAHSHLRWNEASHDFVQRAASGVGIVVVVVVVV